MKQSRLFTVGIPMSATQTMYAVLKEDEQVILAMNTIEDKLPQRHQETLALLQERAFFLREYGGWLARWHLAFGYVQVEGVLLVQRIGLPSRELQIGRA